jgi:hypothetical protein
LLTVCSIRLRSAPMGVMSLPEVTMGI